MKTRKLLSLVAGLAMVASVFATAASAATVGVDEKPTAKVVVNSVEDGMAFVDVMFKIDANDFVAKSKKFDTALKKNVYKGKGIQAIQVEFEVNPEYFDTEEVFTGDNVTGATYVQKANKNMDCTFAALSDDTWILNNEFLLCSFIAITKDETITADFLANCTDIVDFKAFTVKTQAYPVDGATADKAYEFETYYRLDGNGDYLPIVIEGAEKQPEPPAPTASVDVTGAFQTTDADWVAANGKTIYWGVDFANGGFNGTAVAKIFNEAGDERILNIVQDGEINGDASFGVFAILGDKTDALKLTVTSGDVTDTADAFVAAE